MSSRVGGVTCVLFYGSKSRRHGAPFCRPLFRPAAAAFL